MNIVFLFIVTTLVKKIGSIAKFHKSCSPHYLNIQNLIFNLNIN
jgi:hypothetical protein